MAGGAGWAALAAALEGVGSGFQLKRDLDDRDRERRRQQEQDDLNRQRILFELMASKDEFARGPEDRAVREFSDMATKLPPETDLTRQWQRLPAGAQGRSEGWVERTPGQTTPFLPSRQLGVELPPGPVDQAIGTPSSGDAIGQALQARPQPLGQAEFGPIQAAQGSTTTPESVSTVGTAAAQLARTKEARMRQAAVEKAAIDQRQVEINQFKAEIAQARAQAMTIKDQGQAQREWARIAQGEQRLGQMESENTQRQQRFEQGLSALTDYRNESLRIREKQGAPSFNIFQGMPLPGTSQPAPAAPPAAAPRRTDPRSF